MTIARRARVRHPWLDNPRKLLAVLSLVLCAGGSASCGPGDAPGARAGETEGIDDVAEVPQPTTCGIQVAVYPVQGKHNHGYDSTAGDSSQWSCDDAHSNSDFVGGDHLGNDIWATEGTPVVATVSGTLTKVAWSDYSGNKLTIVDDCGWSHFYCHLQDFAPGIGNGDPIEAGEIVGYVGKTGTASNGVVHLHYSIYPDGVYDDGVDPWPHLHAVEQAVCEPGGCAGAAESESCGESELTLDAIAYAEAASTTDVDGDGRADLCGRAAAGWLCRASTGTDWAAHTMPIDGLSDASGWDDVANWSTLRVGDVTGDGRSDVCGRGDAGLRCWPSNGDGFGEPIEGPALSDENSWAHPRYYTTIRLIDFDGDGSDDVCARAADGMLCWRAEGTTFGAAIAGPPWSNANGFDHARYYGTLRTGDIDGDGRGDLCIRASQGIECWLSDGAGFAKRIDGPAWSDASGWSSMHYWSTIRLVDIDGDKRSDICARAANGLSCHRSKGDAFEEAAIVIEAMSDANGWKNNDNYATLRFADLDGDGASDVCARANARVFCWLWAGSGFGATIEGPTLADDTGWGAAEYYRTIQLADISGDGRADLCARGSGFVYCYEFDGKAFGPETALADFTDAGNWDQPAYGATLRIAGPRRCAGADCDPSEPSGGTSGASGSSGLFGPMGDDCSGSCDRGDTDSGCSTAKLPARAASLAPWLVAALACARLRRRRDRSPSARRDHGVAS
jgi:hypothetical protein